MADSAQEYRKSKGKDRAGRKPAPSSKLRGIAKDSTQVRISKTLSWLLRHSAANQGLPIRQDGYVKVDDLLDHPTLSPTGLTLESLNAIVEADEKKRYDLVFESVDEEPATSGQLPVGSWWIKAHQGHSMKKIQVDLKPVLSLDDIPSGIAVHGTSEEAWRKIEKGGLSKMKRNHIHLAQGVSPGNAISGLRKSAQILIFVDVTKALDAGIRFSLSENGVVLTEGDESGFLRREFFMRVEDVHRHPVSGWEGSGPINANAVATEPGPSSEKSKNRSAKRKPLEEVVEVLVVQEPENQ